MSPRRLPGEPNRASAVWLAAGDQTSLGGVSQLFSRSSLITTNTYTTYGTAILKRTGKYAESTAFYNLRNIYKFHAKTGIRLVRTETVHCFLPWHTLQRNLYYSEDLTRLIEKAGMKVDRIIDGIGQGHNILICVKE